MDTPKTNEYDNEGVGCNSTFFKEGRWHLCVKGDLCDNCRYATKGAIKEQIWTKEQWKLK